MGKEKKWFKSKTVWTGIAGMVGAIGTYATGESGSADSIQLGITSLIGIFLRIGMLK